MIATQTYSEVYSTDAISKAQIDAENRVLNHLNKIYNFFSKGDGADLVLSQLEPKDFRWDPKLYEIIEQHVDARLDRIPGKEDDRKVMAAAISQTL